MVRIPTTQAYFQYPLLRAEIVDVAPQYRQYVKNNTKPGDRLPTGAIYLAPMPPMQAMVKFIQQTRPNAANLKWIGQQDIPDLAKTLKLDHWPNDHGVAIKISYDLDGQPVEEAFFGVYYISKHGTDAVSLGQLSMAAGALQQTNWGFRSLQSFRAPAGTLDKRMPMFCVIAKSMYINPEWVRLSKAINDKMMADFNQKMKQGWDQLRAAQAMSEETMRQQAAFQRNFDKQEKAFRNSGGADDSFLRDGGARSAAAYLNPVFSATWTGQSNGNLWISSTLADSKVPIRSASTPRRSAASSTGPTNRRFGSTPQPDCLLSGYGRVSGHSTGSISYVGQRRNPKSGPQIAGTECLATATSSDRSFSPFDVCLLSVNVTPIPVRELCKQESVPHRVFDSSPIPFLQAWEVNNDYSMRLRWLMPFSP
jgi:hypothetical protein